MNESHYLNYNRIEKAIEFISAHFKQQPTLEEIAAHMHLSPFHFQRLFSDWAGITPKQFLHFTSAAYAKKILKENKITLSDAAYETGLSGTGRLHDLFIKLEAMTPGQYKNGGETLEINYHYGDSPFGEMMIASTDIGICSMVFITGRETALTQLQRQYPNAILKEKTNELQQHAINFFTGEHTNEKFKLHLKGTTFQLKVWEALLKIPSGKLTSYGDIAGQIGQPAASRAVGTAIGANPIAFLIPCHRVIQSTGALGDYMWGANRKTALIGWEAARNCSG